MTAVQPAFQYRHMPSSLRITLRFLPFVLVIAVSYAVGEFYPLSSFPMYSKFDDRTYYTYLRSEEGEQLPTVGTAKMYSSQLKKRYGDALKDLKKKYKGSHFDWSQEQKTEAGMATLDWLTGDRKVKIPPGTELVDERIFLRDGKLVHEKEIIGKVKESPPNSIE